MFLLNVFLYAALPVYYITSAHAQFTILPITPTPTRTSATGASSASTSLYIPGFDPQPVSADVVGVDANGRTTWALHRGSVDATDTSSYGVFLGTATLVEGARDASLTYANADAEFTIGLQCVFTESTLAVCTVEAQGSTATQTEVISRQPIQGGGTLTATGTTASTTMMTSSLSSTSSIFTSTPTDSSRTTGAAVTQTSASPAASNSSGSLGPKRGSAALWAVGLAMPYLVSRSRLF